MGAKKDKLKQKHFDKRNEVIKELNILIGSRKYVYVKH